jgi:hypothetical protein
MGENLYQRESRVESQTPRARLRRHYGSKREPIGLLNPFVCVCKAFKQDLSLARSVHLDARSFRWTVIFAPLIWSS